MSSRPVQGHKASKQSSRSVAGSRYDVKATIRGEQEEAR